MDIKRELEVQISAGVDFTREEQKHLIEMTTGGSILTSMGRIIPYWRRILQDTSSITRVISSPTSLGRKYENPIGQRFKKIYHLNFTRGIHEIKHYSKTLMGILNPIPHLAGEKPKRLITNSTIL